jgi:hypothetical protein
LTRIPSTLNIVESFIVFSTLWGLSTEAELCADYPNGESERGMNQPGLEKASRIDKGFAVGLKRHTRREKTVKR